VYIRLAIRRWVGLSAAALSLTCWVFYTRASSITSLSTSGSLAISASKLSLDMNEHLFLTMFESKLFTIAGSCCESIVSIEYSRVPGNFFYLPH